MKLLKRLSRGDNIACKMLNNLILECKTVINTLHQREKFVENLFSFLKEKFVLTDTQIFIFGSFLTENFIPGKSDIDIGIYSENTVKAYDIHYELSTYLDTFNLKHDIVIMELSSLLTINIPIMVYGKTLTDYNNLKLLPYLKSMIAKYGFLEKGLDSANYENN